MYIYNIYYFSFISCLGARDREVIHRIRLILEILQLNQLVIKGTRLVHLLLRVQPLPPEIKSVFTWPLAT